MLKHKLKSSHAVSLIYELIGALTSKKYYNDVTFEIRITFHSIWALKTKATNLLDYELSLILLSHNDIIK